MLSEFESNSPFEVFWNSFQRWIKRTDRIRAHKLDKLDSSLDATLSNLLIIIFHEIFDKWKNVLISLIFADWTNHVADNASHIACINLYLHLTMAMASLPRPTTCGNKKLAFYAETIRIKPLSDFTASIFTSTYESFKRLLYVWMRLISVTSFPKLEAIYVKFLERQRRTLQDLSSAAWIINGMIKVLFSSLVRIFAISLKLSVAKTLIWSCSSVDLCLRILIRSLSTYSF